MKTVAPLVGLVFALTFVGGANSAHAFLTFDGNAKWGSPTLGTGATITWSLIPDGTEVLRRPPVLAPDEPFIFHDFWSGTGNLGSIYAQLNADPGVGETLFLTAVNNAFAAWADAANLTFVQVTDSGLPLGSPGAYAGLVGDIRIGAWDLEGPFGGIGGHAFQPPGGTTPANSFLSQHSPSTFGDITLNTNNLFSVYASLSEGDVYAGFPNDLQNLLTHEIGHALGLNHPADDGLDPGEELAIMRPNLPLTIQRTLSADDIAGIELLYVPEPSTSLLLGISLLVLGRCGIRRNRSNRSHA